MNKVPNGAKMKGEDKGEVCCVGVGWVVAVYLLT